LEILGDIWTEVLIRPMMNSLVLLYYIFFSNFGLSIIVFTVIVRLALVPLTIKQSRQMKAMSALTPKLKAIQARFPGDKARVSQETMKLYKEEGVNPLGCLGPLVIQMPIFFGLFWSLRGTLPSTPERLADLSERLYPWLPQVNQAVPLDGTFLWLDLAKYSIQNPASPVLPILVGGSMFLMQKMTMMTAASAQQASTNRMMLWMMPIMFGFFTFQFESGLALYWIVSNVVGIVVQGFVTGWGPLTSLTSFRSARGPATATVAPQPTDPTPQVEEARNDDHDRDDGQDARRGDRNRPKGARRRARRGRNRRN